jgi:hypothetical protein
VHWKAFVVAVKHPKQIDRPHASLTMQVTPALEA